MNSVLRAEVHVAAEEGFATRIIARKGKKKERKRERLLSKKKKNGKKTRPKPRFVTPKFLHEHNSRTANPILRGSVNKMTFNETKVEKSSVRRPWLVKQKVH